MATFTTPSAPLTPPVLPETRGLQRRLWRHYATRSQGINVYIRDGVATTEDPTGYETTLRVFYGGHVAEEITAEEEAALIAGGFIPDSPGPATWTALADESWGGLAGRTWETLT